jgi:hypothetical protein
VFGLVTDTALVRPRMSTITKAGKGALRLAGSTKTSGQTMRQGLRCTLQPGVVAYPDGVLQAEKLAKFIKQGRGETRVRT